jgi:hypothetical protein
MAKRKTSQEARRNDCDWQRCCRCREVKDCKRSIGKRSLLLGLLPIHHYGAGLNDPHVREVVTDEEL